MGDSTIDFNTDQLSEVPEEANGRVERGTQTISLPSHRPCIAQLGAGSLWKFWQVRHGQVNRPDSSQPIERANDPEMLKAYVPHKVSLGPCRHQPLHENIKNRLLRIRVEDVRFGELVGKMICDKDRIRNWYVRYGSCQFPGSDEDLGRMMARDGIFLLQFLREISNRREFTPSSFTYSFKEISTSPDSNVNDCCGPLQKPIAYLKDVMKFYNQMPMFVLQKILQCEGTYQDLNSILTHALVDLSPIKYDS